MVARHNAELRAFSNRLANENGSMRSNERAWSSWC